MAEEDVQGPPREIFNNINKKVVSNDDVEDENEDLDNEDQGAEFDELALRKYQLDRLRYFYAIVELDSAQSAQHIFSEIDGTEFERTANIFDLRFAFFFFLSLPPLQETRISCPVFFRTVMCPMT